MKKLLAILLLLSLRSFGQPGDDELKRLLAGKNKLADVMQTVRNYFADPQTKNRLGTTAVNRYIKQWARFEWYMSSRLGPNGEFVNINQRLYEATGITDRRQAATPSFTESSTGAWSVIGPLNTENGIGRVDRLAFHPTDANTVYAGSSAGGLWRTTDAGVNWTNLSADLPSAGISGIVIDPVNTNTLYILTGDGDANMGGLVDDYGYMRLCIGVLKSTNGGANWTKMGDFPGADYSTLVGYRLVMHPTDNNILYACTSQGLYMSLNAGSTWGLVNGAGRFFNLEFRPGSGNICYATGSSPGFGRSYFWRSTTSGITWDSTNLINNQINNPTRRVELAVAPSNSSVVYLLAGGVPGNGPGNPVPNLFKGVYRSGDGGLSFILQANSPNIVGRSSTGTDTVQQSNYDLAIAVSNTISSTVLSAGVQVWSSTNAGVNWTFRGSGIHDDVHDLGFHPADNRLWAATDGGVYSSTDNGATWTSHFQDMNITQFYRMDVSPADYLAMIAGAQDNAVKRRSGATSFFDEIACCDGFAVAYDRLNSNIIYSVNNQSINRSGDGGNNFSGITPNNSVNPFSMAMAPHTSLTNALFVGSDTLWRTTNGGANWNFTNINAGWFIRTCPSNGNRVYVAGGTAYNASTGSMRRSDDGGATWPGGNILSNNPGFPLNAPKITSINVDPTNSLRVWITFGGFQAGVKVFYSSDGGANWVNRSGTLPNLPVNCVAIDNSNNAYIGTDNGVYYRGTGMSDWVPFYNNLPYVPVTDIIISEADGRIRASTFGRGIWSTDLYSTCPVNLNITGTLEGQEFHEASGDISSNASLLTSEGTKVQMRGGNEVLLQDGFTARETTQFRAAIGPCGSGGVAGFRVPNVSAADQIPAPAQLLTPPGGRQALVHISGKDAGLLRVQLSCRNSSTAALLLTDETGHVLRRKEIGTTSAGSSNHLFEINAVPAGKYYLHVLIEGRLEHWQELELQ